MTTHFKFVSIIRICHLLVAQPIRHSNTKLNLMSLSHISTVHQAEISENGMTRNE